MNSTAFDTLTRSLIGVPTRRGVLQRLASVLGIALTAPRLPDRADAKNKKRKKPKKNEFGCLNVGKACNGKDRKCCSGICKGKRPKKGKKDKSKCIAHNVGSCLADQDFCLEIVVPCGTDGACFRTTGNASFCGDRNVTDCAACAKDTDCEQQLFGLGSACVVCRDCQDGTACAPLR